MAVIKRPGRFWSNLHFLVRFLGLTGLLVCCVGLVLAHHLNGLLASWGDLGQTLRETLAGAPAPVSAYLLLGGGAAVLLALLVELIRFVLQSAASHSVLGINAVMQTILAAVLLIGVNVWSAGLNLDLFGQQITVAGHHNRFDLTRGKQFTLSEPTIKDMRQLQDTTTVVILQRHRANARVDQSDEYDAAAERKVIEKIKDLVEQLRELGKQFHVEVLDTQARDYYSRLEELGRTAPALKTAIESVPENGIFFASAGQVQQLSFNDFYRLDKNASRKTDEVRKLAMAWGQPFLPPNLWQVSWSAETMFQAGTNGRANLVLVRNRIDSKEESDPVVKRILNLEQRKPRVGVLVVHEALSTEGSLDDLTAAGVGKSLQAHGFEVRDAILKRPERQPMGRGGFVPAVDLLEDSKLDRLKDELNQVDENLKELTFQIEGLTKLTRTIEDPKTPLQDVNRMLPRRLQLPNDRYRPVILALLREELALKEQQKKDCAGAAEGNRARQGTAQ